MTEEEYKNLLWQRHGYITSTDMRTPKQTDLATPTPTVRKKIIRKPKPKVHVIPERAKRNIKRVTTVTAEDWDEARGQWTNLRNTARIRNFSNLLPNQLAMVKLFHENPKSLNGEPVLIVASNNDGVSGNIYPDYAYPATVLSVVESGAVIRLTCLFHPINEEQWGDEKIQEVELFQALPLHDFPEVDTKALREFQEGLVYQSILTSINNNRNTQTTMLKKNLQSFHASVLSLNRDIDRYQKQIEETEQKLDVTLSDELTIKEFQALLDDL